jgi:hypothetical protein
MPILLRSGSVVAPSGRLDDQKQNLFFGCCVVLGGATVVVRVLLRVDAIYGAGIYAGGVFGPMQGSAIT